MKRMQAIVRTSTLTALLCALSAAPALTDSGSVHHPCRQGITLGAWDLPVTSGGLGNINGTLTTTQGQAVFQFRANLDDVPTPCLSCLEGTITGTLDDGIGPGPDFVVRGTYRGAFLAGRGDFRAQVFRPGSLIPRGRIHGEFNDPPPLTGPGTFTGRWAICN